MTQLAMQSATALVVVPKQPLLVESARAYQEGRQPRNDIREIVLPQGLIIDPSFPAVPLGPEQSEQATPESFLPELSDAFVLRVFINPDDLAKISAQNVGVFADPAIEPFITCRGDPKVGDTTDVRKKLDTCQLESRGLDGTDVAVAIVDMGINLTHLTAKLGSTPRLDVANSWTRPGVLTTPGQHPVAHGTMCAYDALIAASNATLLDYDIILQGPEPLQTTLSIALQAYSQLLLDWVFPKLPAMIVRDFVRKGLGHYKGLVVSNSWGIRNTNQDLPKGNPGRYVDNPHHPFQRITATLARFGADIAFAAGDCGVECPNPQCGSTSGSIMGANANAAVLSVAGCDIHDYRVGYSSQGPSIAGMAAEKPDVTAYTHFLGSEINPGRPDSGISAACPVAAGCIASLRTKAPASSLSPAVLFRLIKHTARQVPGPAGWNKDYGHGIIDPIHAARKYGLI